MSANRQLGVCARLAEIRARKYGPRGKSRFARDLGIGSSTYDRYERDRMPPADLLLKAANLAGVSLEWLISGVGPTDEIAAQTTSADRLTTRLRSLLARQDNLAERVDRFLTQLEQELPPE